jgi:hypothetical protein
MLKPPFSFDAIMAPLGAERFFAEYEGQRPLGLPVTGCRLATCWSPVSA